MIIPVSDGREPVIGEDMKSKIALLLAVTTIGTAILSKSIPAAETATLTMSGISAEGYLKVVVEGMGGVVRDAYPGSAVTLRPSSPAGGIQALANGTADLMPNAAIPEIRAALEGTEPFKQSLKGKLMSVMRLHDEQVMYSLMTKEWADKYGIRSYADIAQKKPPMRLSIHFDACMVCTVSQAYAIFKEYGFSVSDVEKWGGEISRGNSTKGLEQMADGKIDVLINGRFLPDELVADAARKRPFLWIDSDPDKMKAAAEAWGYELWMVPKGAFPFLDKDMPTIRQAVTVIGSSQTSADNIYKFLKALYDGRERLRQLHPALAQFSGEEMVKVPGELPMHPGAEKFYREKGLIK